MSVKNKFPNIKPSLNLDFANSKQVDPRISFTRASTATYWGDKGVLQTAASDVPRIDHDPVTGECKGLLIEEQRTNLLTYSEQFDNPVWSRGTLTSTGNAPAPDGSLTAAGYSTGGSFSYLYQKKATISESVYTVSVYLKHITGAGILAIRFTDTASQNYVQATVNLTAGTIGSVLYNGTGKNGAASISLIGNGWFRVSISGAITQTLAGLQVTNATFGAETFYIWGAQLEVGAFPTSYIPTTSAQVTRAADAASMTGTNFISWYRQDEGSFSYEILRPENRFYPPVVYAGKATDQNYVGIDGSGSGGTPRVVVLAGGVVQANFSIGVAWVSGPNKGTAAYKLNDFAGVSNGGSVQTDISGTAPSTISELNIGWNGTQRLNSHIKRIAYYPKRLSNAEIQALTA